jgi:hypothetical protein
MNMQLTDRIAVTLDAQTWETVLRVIAKSPVSYEIVAPLIASIQQQCASHAEGRPPLGLVPRDNEAES